MKRLSVSRIVFLLSYFGLISSSRAQQPSCNFELIELYDFNNNLSLSYVEYLNILVALDACIDLGDFSSYTDSNSLYFTSFTKLRCEGCAGIDSSASNPFLCSELEMIVDLTCGIEDGGEGPIESPTPSSVPSTFQPSASPSATPVAEQTESTPTYQPSSEPTEDTSIPTIQPVSSGPSFVISSIPTASPSFFPVPVSPTVDREVFVDDEVPTTGQSKSDSTPAVPIIAGIVVAMALVSFILVVAVRRRRQTNGKERIALPDSFSTTEEDNANNDIHIESTERSELSVEDPPANFLQFDPFSPSLSPHRVVHGGRTSPSPLFTISEPFSTRKEGSQPMSGVSPSPSWNSSESDTGWADSDGDSQTSIV